MNSRNKGKVGELELAAVLRDRGFDARRGQQFRGGQNSPDVVGIPGVHVECKRVEAGNLYTWLAQAVRDAGNKMPVVMHRRNRQEWVAILKLDDFLALVRDREILNMMRGDEAHAVQEQG